MGKHELYEGLKMADATPFAYDRIICLHTQTTGLNPKKDQPIELAALIYSRTDNGWDAYQYDKYAKMSPGIYFPPDAQKANGLNPGIINRLGVPEKQLLTDFSNMVTWSRTDRPSKVCLISYNANFDLAFLTERLNHYNMPPVIEQCDKLDLMTVFYDRRPLNPRHTALAADEVYGTKDMTPNAKGCIHDVRRYRNLAAAMDYEDPINAGAYRELFLYVNKFGFQGNRTAPKYRLPNVQYAHQGCDNIEPLYMRFGNTPMEDARADLRKMHADRKTNQLAPLQQKNIRPFFASRNVFKPCKWLQTGFDPLPEPTPKPKPFETWSTASSVQAKSGQTVLQADGKPIVYKLFRGDTPDGNETKEAHDFQKATGWNIAKGNKSNGFVCDVWMVYKDVDLLPDRLKWIAPNLDHEHTTKVNRGKLVKLYEQQQKMRKETSSFVDMLKDDAPNDVTSCSLGGE